MIEYNFVSQLEKVLDVLYMKQQVKNDKGLLEIFIEDYGFKYLDEGYIEVRYYHKNLVYVLYSVDKRDLAALAFGC